MPITMRELAVPILIIVLGSGWLLSTLGVLPGVNWIWVLGIGVAGALALVLGGIDRVTLVIGPFLIIGSIFSVLRQTGRLTIDTEVPCLVILFGVLMLLTRLLKIPPPKWLVDQAGHSGDGSPPP